MKKRVSMSLKMSCKIFVAIVFICLISCSESKYSGLVKSEMAKGIVNDSLFLGLKLGQSRKEFFDTCWQLNRDQKVTNGPNGYVMYSLPDKEGDSINTAITMLFYGIFNEEYRMTGMNMQFSYDAWSLWNTSLHSDILIHAIQDTLNNWYPGNDFIKVEMEKSQEELYVKVDGNRRITIKPLDDKMMVKAQIDDLRYVLEN